MGIVAVPHDVVLKFLPSSVIGHCFSWQMMVSLHLCFYIFLFCMHTIERFLSFTVKCNCRIKFSGISFGCIDHFEKSTYSWLETIVASQIRRGWMDDGQLIEVLNCLMDFVVLHVHTCVYVILSCATVIYLASNQWAIRGHPGSIYGCRRVRSERYFDVIVLKFSQFHISSVKS